MIRWLSEYWANRGVERTGEPTRLWRVTFGRLASHRRFATRLQQLDAQLIDQAQSQQSATAAEPWPIGSYSARPHTSGRHTRAASADRQSRHHLAWRYSALATVGLCAIVSAVIWFARPSDPTEQADQLRMATVQSIGPVMDSLAKQVRDTGRALRQQTDHVAKVPNQLPAIDRVVNDLALAIETPIRQEMQRITDDVTRPWTYLASQLPRPVLREKPKAQAS